MAQAQTQPTVRQSLQNALSEAGQTSEQKVEAWSRDKPDFERLRKFMAMLAERDAAQMEGGRPSSTGAITHGGYIDMDKLYAHAKAADAILAEERAALDGWRNPAKHLARPDGTLNLDELSRLARERLAEGKGEDQTPEPPKPDPSSVRSAINRALAERSAAENTTED